MVVEVVVLVEVVVVVGVVEAVWVKVVGVKVAVVAALVSETH